MVAERDWEITSWQAPMGQRRAAAEHASGQALPWNKQPAKLWE